MAFGRIHSIGSCPPTAAAAAVKEGKVVNRGLQLLASSDCLRSKLLRLLIRPFSYHCSLAACRYMTKDTIQLHLASNGSEGNLSATVNSSLTAVLVHNALKLCGMVPASLRYTKDGDPCSTHLGQPCQVWG